MTALDRRTLMAATVAGIATPTALGANRVGSQIDQFFRERLHPDCISGAPAKFDPDIVAFHPTQVIEPSLKLHAIYFDRDCSRAT